MASVQPQITQPTPLSDRGNSVLSGWGCAGVCEKRMKVHNGVGQSLYWAGTSPDGSTALEVFLNEIFPEVRVKDSRPSPYGQTWALSPLVTAVQSAVQDELELRPYFEAPFRFPPWKSFHPEPFTKVPMIP